MSAIDFARLLAIPELPAYLKQVDHLLVESIGSAAPSIRQSALRLIEGGGKRLRPALVIAAVKSQCGEIDEAVLKACAALELVHLSSLAHDDVMDNAAIRWGAPTIHQEEGASHAILVGDYLLALSACVASSINPAVAAAVARAVLDMCDGQSLETADVCNIDRSIESYVAAIKGKTAALFAAACRVGAMCAKASPERVNALAAFGESFGVAYQLLDDLLDFLSTPAILGKPIGSDTREGVYTLPILLALRRPAGDRLRERFATGHVDSEKLVATLTSEGVFEETKREIEKYNARAACSLDKMSGNAAASGLARLPTAYLDTVLEKYVPSNDVIFMSYKRTGDVKTGTVGA